MSCDCAAAPRLSGPGQSNVIKAPGESVQLEAQWCNDLSSEGVIELSVWTVSPAVGDEPLLVTEEDQAELVTSAIVTQGDGATLYVVTNTVTGRRSPTSPLLTLEYRWEVWVTGASPAFCENCL